MEINFLVVVLGAIIAMILGAIWYGPLFGNIWLKIIGATEMDTMKRKEMQKKAMPLYLIQFILALFQVFVLARLTLSLSNVSALETALWLFAGFIVPTVAASAMWNNDSRQIAWGRFLIQAGYQLVLFVIWGFILGLWL